MMMAASACYANYDMSHQQQHALHMHHQEQQQQQQSRISSVAAVLAAAAASATIIPQTDYNIPLHVDCSVEYELPNQPKPPVGERVEPLLMIHPCYFRKMESQRRSPFINNMPNSSRTNVILSGNTSSRRTTRQSHINQQQQEQNHRQQQPQRYHSHHLHSTSHHSLILGQQIQNQMSQMSQQAHYPIVNNIHQHQPTSSTSEYAEQNIRRTSIIQSLTNNNSQKVTNWDKNSSSIAIVTSLPQQTTGISGVQPVETVNISGKSMYSKPVGKRDAMISGGCISNNNNSNKLIDQHNNNNINNNNNSNNINNNNNNNNIINNNNNNNNINNNNSINNNINNNNINNNIINNNNLNRHIKINNNNSAGCISLSSDSTNLKIWETSTSLINRSPMATVPSNYQAGPETTSTPINNNNNNNINNNSRNDDLINGKYRQYLRSHRNHPYLVTAKTIGHIYPQQLSATVTAASFSQLHQMSCYNA